MREIVELAARIAELERDKKALRGIEENLREHIDIGTLQLSVATARIAELEMKIRHNALWQASEDAEERAHLEKLVPDLKKRIAELEAENDRLQDAWFKDETICPDGSLKPKVSTLLSRIAELEAFIDQLIEIGEWGVTGMVIATSFSVGKIHDLAERRQNEWLTLVKDWKEREDSE